MDRCLAFLAVVVVATHAWPGLLLFSFDKYALCRFRSCIFGRPDFCRTKMSGMC